MASYFAWLSASRLADVAECEKYALHKDAHPEPPNKYPLLGKLRHKVIEICHKHELWPPTPAEAVQLTTHYHAADPEWKRMIGPEDLDKTSKAMAVLASRPDLWPSRDSILSVEGSGIPDAFWTQCYDNEMFAVPVDTTGPTRWGLRGIFDLIYRTVVIRRGNRTLKVLVARDWKGSSGDYIWQARIYALAMWMIWPGYDEYWFEPLFITNKCQLKRYVFAETTEFASESKKFELLGEAFDKVTALALRTIEIRRSKVGTAKPGSKCFLCPVKASCLPYQVASAKRRALKAGTE